MCPHKRHIEERRKERKGVVMTEAETRVATTTMQGTPKVLQHQKPGERHGRHPGLEPLQRA